MRKAIPKPCIGPIESRVFSTSKSSVPCSTSDLEEGIRSFRRSTGEKGRLPHSFWPSKGVFEELEAPAAKCGNWCKQKDRPYFGRQLQMRSALLAFRLSKSCEARGSRLRYGRPNLHRGRGAVGPGVIRNESQRERLGFSSLVRVAEVQEAALRGLSIMRACMAQHDDSTKQVLLKFLLELRARFWAQVQRHVLQRHTFRLVDLRQTVHEWSALDRHAAGVLGDLRVGLEKLWSHIKLHADDVASGPAAPNWKILTGSGACDRLSVGADLRAVSPSRNTQEKRELGGFGRGEDNFHAAIPGIISFLADFQTDTALEM